MQNNFLRVALLIFFSSMILSELNAQYKFDHKTDYILVGDYKDIAIGDLNGDGKPDIVVSNNTDKSFSVFTNTGTGTFGGKINYTTTTVNPNMVLIEDMNSDGYKDIIITDLYDIYVFTNSGTGSFNQKTVVKTSNYSLHFIPDGLAIKDINADGKPDLAVGWDNKVKILTATGIGTFDSVGIYDANEFGRSIYLEDMNGDNKPDILAITTYGGDLSIFNNDGTGKFTLNYNTSINSINKPAAIGDFNNDNINDFAITSWDSDRFNVFKGSNTGFVPYAIQGYGGSMEGIYTKDLTGDNNLDLVLISRQVDNNHAISVFKGTGTGFFDLTESYAAGTGHQKVVLEDLDGNGVADMALLDGDKLSIYLSKEVQQINNIPVDLCLKSSLFTITATSGLPVILTSSDPSVFAVSGSSATATGVGLVTITALQIGNSEWAGVFVTNVITVYQESVPACDSVVAHHLIPDQVTLSGGSFSVTIPGCYFLHHSASLTLKVKGPASLLADYVVNFTSPGIVTITGSHPGTGQLPTPTYVLGVITVVSGPVTAIEQNEELKVLKIYPNPSQGNFIVELGSIHEAPLNAQIYNSQGSLVGEMNLNRGLNEFNMVLFPGIYLVRSGSASTKLRIE